MSDIFIYTFVFFLIFFVLMLFAVQEVKFHKENTLFEEHLKILRKRALDNVLGKEEEDNGNIS